MPTILRLKKKEKEKRIYTSKKDNLNHKIYNSNRWRKLRLEYLKRKPMCEICEENNIITLANEVHHIIPISTASTLIQKQILGYDENNLMSLCSDCHKNIHNNV